ncbi:MAG TPA: hypothetical protein VLX31_01885 [Streptosporangiaceae bacterium]|nr:hypothetical protein [Streptosporangiaceae bacterium]
MSRPELRPLGPWYATPQPYQSTVRHRLHRALERAQIAGWDLVTAVLRRAATPAMRRRAWAAGLALALDGPGARWLSCLREYDDGNQLGEELRYDAQGTTVKLRMFALPPVTAPVADRAFWADRGRHRAPGRTARVPWPTALRPPATTGRHARPARSLRGPAAA